MNREFLINDLMENEEMLFDERKGTKYERDLIEWYHGKFKGNSLPSKEDYLNYWREFYNSKSDHDIEALHEQILAHKYE